MRSKETRKRMSESRLGKHYSIATEFKKGNPSVFRGKKRPNIQGENHFAWKGNKVGYFGIHSWLKRHYGKPKKCEKCGITNKEKRIEWANVSGKYLRNRNDFKQLCVKHHRMFDKNCPDFCPCGREHYSSGFCSRCRDKMRNRKSHSVTINGVVYVKK